MQLVVDTIFAHALLPTRVGQGPARLTVVVKGTFVLAPSPAGGRCVAAAEQAGCHGDVYFDDDPAQGLRYEADVAPTKPRGECFLVGTCHPPQPPAAVCAVSFAVGGLHKSLVVVGDRRWEGPVIPTPTPPEPFTEMPLRPHRAYGGPGYPDNPLGRGFVPRGASAHGVALPNLDLPGSQSPGEALASTLPRPRTAPARLARAGTYDPAWLAAVWPALPADLDPAYFNAAPDDQHHEGFWRGDEEITLQHLHPRAPLVRARLPGAHPRCFVGTQPEALTELPLRLDTVTVDADLLRVFCLWRGVVALPPGGVEALGGLFLLDDTLEAPRSLDACRARFAQLLARRTHDDQEYEPVPLPADGDNTRGLTGPDLEAVTQEAAAAEALEGVRARLKAAGLDPDLAVQSAAEAPPRPPVHPTTLREHLVAAGLPEAEAEAVVASLAGPPTAPDPTPRGERLREEVRARHGRGESFAGEDLTGAPLAGLDLRGADFSRAILAGADLTDARLDDAHFAGADLSRAVLVRASFSRADLSGADLSAAQAERARFEEATLRDAVLAGATLRGARFLRAQAAGCDLTRADLHEAAFDGATLDRAEFDRARIAGARFVEASLVEASFLHVRGARVVMDRATLTRLRAGLGATLTEGSFRSVRAAESVWRGASLEGADFTGADLTRAEFSEARMPRALLEGVRARQGRFLATYLPEAVLWGGDFLGCNFEGADLSRADLSQASLFAADLSLATLDGVLTPGTNLGRTRLDPEAPWPRG